MGGLRVDVHAALKLGGAELAADAQLMNAVNGRAPRTFARVQRVVRLGDGRTLLVFEELRRHDTLLQAVFCRATSGPALDRLAVRFVTAVRAVHATPSWPGVNTRPRPFGSRLRQRLEAVLGAPGGQHLESLWDTPGTVMGRTLPPASEWLAVLRSWEPESPGGACLVHGDAHLANALVRRRGASYSMRLIDPNSTVGVSTPFYDFGKMMHFTDPLGWLRVKPGACAARFRRRAASDWSLAAEHDPPRAAEARRRRFERGVLQALRVPDGDARILSIAIASAHIGLAALTAAHGDRRATDFAMAHCLGRVAEWLTA